MQEIKVEDWGITEYGEAWQRQENWLKEALEQKRLLNGSKSEERNGMLAADHRLILCGHPHVYTLGKSGKQAHLLLNDSRMKALNAAFYPTNRGGDITYHGPGQIVGYPLFDLEKFKTDLGWYMRSLEEVIIKTIAYYGIKGGRLAGATGVWLDADNPARARKICAMGVRCSRWLTMHGFALNANTDLSYFGHIVPCGITDKGVTSIATETNSVVDEEELKSLLIAAFGEVFDAAMITAPVFSFA